MLGLRSPGATGLVVGLAGLMLLGIMTTGPDPVGVTTQLLIALILTVITLVVFRWRGARPPARVAAAVTVLFVITAVLAAWVEGGEPYLITTIWVGTGWIVPQTFLAARGRPGWAVLSFVATAGITTAGAVLFGGDTEEMVTDHVGRLPLVLMSLLFGVAIERRARDIAALRTRIQENVDEQAAAAAALVARDQRLRWIRETAGPTLDRIAAGDEFTAAELVDVAVLEAHIRDTIRAPGLIGEPLDDAVAKARKRDVTVILLDDRGTPHSDRAVLDRAREVARQRIEATRAGRVVVRLLPPGRDVVLSFAGDASPGRRAYSAEELEGLELQL